jgi:hypothetical protein
MNQVSSTSTDLFFLVFVFSLVIKLVNLGSSPQVTETKMSRARQKCLGTKMSQYKIVPSETKMFETTSWRHRDFWRYRSHFVDNDPKTQKVLEGLSAQ